MFLDVGIVFKVYYRNITKPIHFGHNYNNCTWYKTLQMLYNLQPNLLN